MSWDGVITYLFHTYEPSCHVVKPNCTLGLLS